MNYEQAVELVKEYGKTLNAYDPRFERHVSISLYDDSTLELNNSFIMELDGGDVEYIVVFSLNHEDKVYPITKLLRFEQYEVVPELEKLVVKQEEKLPVCNTCDDTHMVWHEDYYEVMCVRCPVPCSDCRGKPQGAYCSNTPCDCPCHNKTY
jgi:DnaJ-class molecular chaperone